MGKKSQLHQEAFRDSLLNLLKEISGSSALNAFKSFGSIEIRSLKGMRYSEPFEILDSPQLNQLNSIERSLQSCHALKIGTFEHVITNVQRERFRKFGY